MYNVTSTSFHLALIPISQNPELKVRLETDAELNSPRVGGAREILKEAKCGERSLR